jgi:hypothetical protein
MGSSAASHPQERVYKRGTEEVTIGIDLGKTVFSSDWDQPARR